MKYKVHNMNKLSVFILKMLRKVYQKMTGYSNEYKPDCDQDPDTVSHTIYEVLISDKPCMISRFGSNELNCIINYLAIKGGKKSLLSYIKGDSFQWWWNPGIVKNLHLVAGFFPPKEKCLNRFCELMIKDIPEVDILGSWLNDELKFSNALRHAKKVQLDFLNPYFSKIP